MSKLTQIDDMVLNAVMDIITDRKNRHRVPECALRREIVEHIRGVYGSNETSSNIDASLRLLVDRHHLRKAETINDKSYYIAVPMDKIFKKQ